MFRKYKPTDAPDLIQDNMTVDAYLDITTLIKVTAMLYVIVRECRNLTENPDVASAVKTIVLGINLVTTVYGRYRNQADHQRTIKPIEEEKRHSKQAFRCIGIANCSRLARLQLVHTPQPHTAAIHVNQQVQTKHLTHNLATLSWTPGQGDILKQVENADFILNHLPRHLLEQCSNIEPPWFTKTWLQLVPYANQAFKTSSKTRSIMFPLVTNNAIDLLYGVATSTLPFSKDDVFSSILAAVMMLMYATESYLLSDRQIRMSFEGYNRISGYFFSRRPTCIGQQINSELLFYPNVQLRLAADYIVRTHLALCGLAKSGALQNADISVEVKSRVNRFFRFMDSHSNMSSYRIETANDAESALRLA